MLPFGRLFELAGGVPRAIHDPGDRNSVSLCVDGVENRIVSHRNKADSLTMPTLNTSIFVTGSNSTLWSGELATLLTGRTVEFEIMPFSFREMRDFFELNNMEWNDDLFYDYLMSEALK